MKKWVSFKSKKDSQLGASLVEYGLLLALIAVIAIPSVIQAGKTARCKNFVAGVLIGAEPNDSYIPGYVRYRVGPSSYVTFPPSWMMTTGYTNCLNGNFHSMM